MVQYKCSVCGAKYPITTKDYHCFCGGLYQIDFSAPTFDLSLVDKSEWSIFRYRAFMPALGEEWRNVTLGEGLTATLSWRENLYLKLDYAMPTLSFKDRGAAALIWLCKSIGVSKVVQDSSGNAGNSVAAYCARAGLECEIYVPKGTSPSKINMITSHGAVCTVYDGTRDQTADACRKRASDDGLYYANHVYNPFFYEGTKTFIYEIYEQMGRIPDNLFIPVGNGTLLLGCQIAICELHKAGAIERLPHLYIVQSERCAPLYNADKLPRKITPEHTYAEGIAIGQPMRGREILAGGYPGERTVITAPEAGILPAREELARGGMYVEHTTAATYAAYLAYKSANTLSGDTLIPLCGAGLKSDK